MGTAPANPSAPTTSAYTPPAVSMPAAPEPVPVSLPLKAPARTETATTAAVTPKTETPRPDPLPAETARAAHRTSSGSTSLIRALGLKIGKVVIDPGHGGHDQGTESAKGLREKDLVLDIAKRVGALIEEHLGAEVIYTRSDDTFIPLEARTALANDNKADLFLSIHANSSPLTRIAGVETYYRSFTNA